MQNLNTVVETCVATHEHESFERGNQKMQIYTCWHRFFIGSGRLNKCCSGWCERSSFYSGPLCGLLAVLHKRLNFFTISLTVGRFRMKMSQLDQLHWWKFITKWVPLRTFHFFINVCNWVLQSHLHDCIHLWPWKGIKQLYLISQSEYLWQYSWWRVGN